MDMEIDDSESEYEEEEYLVYVDIEPTSLAESQIRQAKNLRIYGLEEKKPLLQINNTFFEGNLNSLHSSVTSSSYLLRFS